jgi:threonine aldolase
MTDREEMLARRDRCSRFLDGHGPVRPAELLATIPADTQPDTYGQGGVVAQLEAEVCGLLGKPAAAFLPSGIMGQQAVLRVHADTRQRRTVLFHPMCHLEQHEEQAHQRLHGLVGRPVGNRNRLITLEDLREVSEPAAALLIELPQRDIGGQQPPFEDLLAQVAWAHERGTAAHLDGARLWESAAGYGKPPAQIAALFDTVYVSFYKGIGALAGCCIAGPEDVIAQVRDWRRRMGGTLHDLWPNAASALSCLGRRLPLFPAYLDHARALAAALAVTPGVTVLPDPPQTPMMHLLLAVSSDGYQEAAKRLAADRGIWISPEAMTTADPGVQRIELSVGDATMDFKPGEASEIFAAITSQGGP